jgi:sulfur carrier protein
MIVVNGEPWPWREGLTVKEVLDEKNYRFPLLHVRLNDAHVPRDAWSRTPVPDLATVDVLHMMSGG